MQAFAKTTRTHLKKFDSSERKVTLDELGDVPKLGLPKKVVVKKEATSKEKIEN
jgi:hypothetical protein